MGRRSDRVGWTGRLARGARPFALLFAFALALLCAAAGTPAHTPHRAGYALEQHPALGLSFLLSRTYEQIPTQPDEPWIVLYYAESLPKEPAARRAVRPAMGVLWIDRPVEAGDPGGGAAERAGTPRVVDLESWVAERMPRWRLGPPVDARKPRAGYEVREHQLSQKESGEPRLAGWVCALESAEHTVAVFGTCAASDLEEQVKLWRASAEKLRVGPRGSGDDAALARLYAGSSLSDVGYRIEVRRRLARGWRAEDTEHYVIVHDTSDASLIRKIALDAELLRLEYERWFPPAEPIERVSTIRVCRDRDQYLAYGGMEDSAGYWNASNEELVLYDARRPQKNQPDDDGDTLAALYHEAFHQYVHYSAGEIAPHAWFNEGHGDFFAGADVHGSVRGIGVNTWRIDLARTMAEQGTYAPWSRLVRHELRPFMDDGWRSYAQSWSMIHFLRLSPVVERRPEWRRILPTYFETLQSAYASELALLEDAGQADDLVARWKAGFDARNRAVDVAFEGVDFDEIERAWVEYVRRLPAPKPR